MEGTKVKNGAKNSKIIIWIKNRPFPEPTRNRAENDGSGSGSRVAGTAGYPEPPNQPTLHVVKEVRRRYKDCEKEHESLEVVMNVDCVRLYHWDIYT